MEQSILKSTKKILGLADDYTAFDHDIITHINSTFTVLHQLGVGPPAGFFIEDDLAVWDDFVDTESSAYGLIRTYVYLKVRMVFDPPSTSFVIEAMNKQIAEHEWRISNAREGDVMAALAEAELEEIVEP